MLKEISLVQYKNHLQLQKTFSERIVAITGSNGSGKTNILDAVYYLCYGKSYFAKADKSVANFNSKGFRVQGIFEKDEQPITTTIIYREDGKKELNINDEQIKKAAHLLQFNSCVMIAPDDISIINESGEDRRKYIDTILCQIDADYMQHLITYNKLLVQRNALLKQMNEQRQKQNQLLDVYNIQLANSGNYIYQQRSNHFITLKEKIISNYMTIAGKTDDINLQYESHLTQGGFVDLLVQSLQKDLITQRTNVGIHKDDINFLMNFEKLKQTASQGQKKSLLLALKLTELQYLMELGHKQPILMLDDIMERLDDERIHFLIKYISTQLNNMVIISDVSADRTKNVLAKYTTAFEIWEIGK